MKTEKGRIRLLAGIIKEGEEIETVNIAKIGDYIVKNPTGEKYVLTKEKFKKNYYITPIKNKSDSKGYFEYKNKKEERNVVKVNQKIMNDIRHKFTKIPTQDCFLKFTNDLNTVKAEKNVIIKARVSKKNEKIVTFTKIEKDDEDVFKFKASWGENMILKIGDFLVVSSNEVYRIGKREFESTYIIKKV